MTMRVDGRDVNQIRPIKVTYGIYGNAHGSALFEMGNTRILCSVMMQDGVPRFLKGTGKGWLTAEYTLLPASTLTRTPREMSIMQKNGRSTEISRLIGRSLRAVTNLKALGEKTLYIDCDVLQADGGTRTAAISGAYCALRHAVERWVQQGIIKEPLLHDDVAAVSVGLLNGQPLLDLNFSEDCKVDADFNFVMTGSGNIIEIQGAAETKPISADIVMQMQQVAFKGIVAILEMTNNTVLLPIFKTDQLQGS